MTETIRYTVEVDGETMQESFTTADVSDKRAGWNPDVAEAYAQHLAVEAYGTDIDVNTVEITQLGESHAQYDETGGVPL